MLAVAAVGQAIAQTHIPDLTKVELPGRYFQLLEAGIERVGNRLAEQPQPTLASLEARPGWSHFPNAILMPAVLYTKLHPLNKRYKDARLLRLAETIGDLLVNEYGKGNYTTRGDNDWDTYMWLEAYRLLESKLGEDRRLSWKQVLLKELALLQPKLALCQDYPMYNAPFITTSPNH